MRFALSVAGFLLAFVVRAAGAQDLLPPVLPWHGASEALIAPPGDPWITPAEKTGLLDSPDYATTVAFLEKICAASPQLELRTFGRTAQGRALHVVVATREKAFTPAALRAGGKPTLLVQAGIHAGEIEGKDAGLMLLRALAFGAPSALLERANLLFVPMLNADGHERSSEWNRPNQRGPVHQGWRTTAQNLNLNRDYLKADTPELRALLSLLETWQPALYLDVHTTDGIDYQYDITYTYNGVRGTSAWSPQIAAWLDRAYHPAVTAALEAAGHVPINLYINPRDDRDLAQGLATGHAGPRFSQGYGDLRHLPSVLIETHSLKSYRQRVLGTYVLLAAALELVGRDQAALQAAIAADRAARPALLPVNFVRSDERREIEFRGIAYEKLVSPASGVAEVRWTGRPQLYPQLPVFGDRPSRQLRRPAAYWVPITKPEVIDRLRLHGVIGETLSAARTVKVEMYRLIDPQPAALPVEGRHALRAGVKPEAHTETFPAGSVRVSTDQPLGEIAMALLEPECSDSLLAWGFFPEILQHTEYIEGYVIAPLAEQMLAGNPQLKAEFTAKLAAEPAFAANPTARLQWFYERSPFHDTRHLLYPIGIER